MLAMTYVLQGCAALLMAGAAILVFFTVRRGNYPLVAFQVVLFAANAGLFYWQGMIRASLN